MKYFISSKWRNRDKVLELTKKLRNRGKFVYCFFESKANIYSTDMDPKKVRKSSHQWRISRYFYETGPIYRPCVFKN